MMWLTLLSAGLVPPSNGVRFIEPDPFVEIRREADRRPEPTRLARLPGWTPARRVTTKERRWAEKVLRLNSRLGAFVIRRVDRREVLGRVEIHQHPGGEPHRGVSLYVRVKWEPTR